MRNPEQPVTKPDMPVGCRGRARTSLPLADSRAPAGIMPFSPDPVRNRQNWRSPASTLLTLALILPAVGAYAQHAEIATGGEHTCALTRNFGVQCWGSNASGQLGDNTTLGRLNPVDVSGLGSGVSSVAAGSAHTCALTNLGGVKCWGSNASGQLGDNTTTRRLTPVDVAGLTSGISAIAAGASHTCAITEMGRIKCWGENSNGQLGDQSTVRRLTPVDVNGFAAGISEIALGSKHTCAVSNLGAIKCWGDNSGGQSGSRGNLLQPAPVNITGFN